MKRRNIFAQRTVISPHASSSPQGDCADEFNPYRAPQMVDDGAGATERTPEICRLIDDYRTQCTAVGACWCIFGVLLVLIALLAETLSRTATESPVTSLLWREETWYGVGMGGVWMLAGIGSISKQFWAVCVGSIAAGLSIVGNHWNLGCFSPALGIFLLVQCGRVFYLAAHMHSLGIPLSSKA